ncbi:DUF6263 family protein [Schlesneria sp.]|uniref:DUF6263 family protein n=1 Tax=Schlesneria sp. TaxID=2762018 RepID=UPI002F17A352
MSNQRLRMYLSLLGFAFGLSGVAAADETTFQLVYHFKPGQFFHYEQSDRAELTTQSGSNQALAIQQTQTFRSFRVISVDDDGSAVIEPVVESVRMASQTGESGVVGYDSTKDEVIPKGFESLAGTVGRPLARFQVSANGRLNKVTLLVNDVPKKFAEAAEKTDPAINCLVVFPEKAVKIGEKWSEKSDTPVSVGNNLTQDLGLIRVYELAKVENDIATIRFRTSLRVPMHDPDILRQIVQQTPSGTIEFDLKEGKILSRSLKIDEKVIGAFGPQTLLQAQGEMLEKLVPARTPAKVGAKPVSAKAN